MYLSGKGKTLPPARRVGCCKDQFLVHMTIVRDSHYVATWFLKGLSYRST
jgi:hypothetical protein